jgi:hypothetical protein
LDDDFKVLWSDALDVYKLEVLLNTFFEEVFLREHGFEVGRSL